MNLRALGALVVIVVVLASPTAAAQTAESFVDPVTGVSLEQAIARALAQEPSLRAIRTTVDAARGVQVQAGLRKNPSVTTDFRREPSGTDDQAMVSVEWPLDLFRRQGRVTVADRELEAAEHAVADRERLSIAEVRARFGAALSAVRDLAVLEELIDATRRQLELLRARVESGVSPPLERDLVEVEVQRLNADRSLQWGRAERAMYELKRAIGAPPADSLRLRDTLEGIVSGESAVGPVESEAATRRADVREAAARVALADARIDRARREGRFDVTLFAGYMRMDSGFAQLGISRSGTPERIHGLFNYVTGGATVSLPVFNRNQGDIAAARSERSGALAMQEAAALSAETEIASARSFDRRAHDAARQYAADARSLARQNLSVVRQSYELGRTTIFEVLAEQKRFLDLERAYTETLGAAYEARTALIRAVGETR